MSNAALPPVSLIIPVYNERAGVAAAVRKARHVLEELLPKGSELILVDDGSTDGTATILDGLLRYTPETIKLVRHPRNKGYGAALKSGIAVAANPWIAITDADGTYPLSKLPKLLSRVAGGARMAVGARALEQQPRERRMAKAFLNRFASYLADTAIPDLNSGLRVFHREDAQRLRRLLPDGFSFTTTLTMALLTEGERVEWIPISYRVRSGRSKINPPRDFFRFIMLLLRMTMAFNPLRVFGPAAVVLLSTGLMLLVLRALLSQTVALATTVVLLVGGLQVLAIGLLADLINRRG